MKKGIFILFAVLILISCIKTDMRLAGIWIEKDNFRNPMIYKFSKDSFQEFNGKKLYTTKIYLLKKDTFITNHFFEIHKNRISLNGNILNFIDLNSDTVIYSLEKGDFKNSLNYFNKKKGTNISLPKLNTEDIRDDNYLNSIYIDSQGTIYFNGEKSKINDLESKLMPHADFDRIHTLIFCDKTVSLSKLQEVKSELIKFEYYFVTYITQNNENQLEGINVRLPWITEPQLILDLITENNFETLICKVKNDKIFMNEKEISSNQLFNVLKDKISQKKNELNVIVYFDNKINYETYLKEFYNIRNAYYSVRREYSKNKFGDSDYELIEDSISKKIREIYPMRFIENVITCD